MFRSVVPAALLLGVVTAYAADNTSPSAPVVVTAARSAESTDDTLASVTVITRADIERQQARSLPDLLTGVPGLFWSNNGGSGKATFAYLRGSESDHILVLIDGVKVGSATTGTTAFQDISLEQIERIEIVRGPRSSLYGSEAVGGVIQIFTREAHGPITPAFSIGTGTYDTRHASAAIGGGNDSGWFHLAAEGLRTDGFNACEGALSGGCYTIEPDDDGNRTWSMTARAGHRYSATTEADVQWSRTRSEPHYDGSFGNESRDAQQLASGRLRFALGDTWLASLIAGRSWDQSDSYQDSTYVSSFNTRRDTVSFQNDFILSANDVFTAGVDYNGDRIDSSTDYAATARDVRGLFLQQQSTLGAHDVQLALRGDDNSQFGRHNTGSVAWGYAFGAHQRVFASYGTAYKAPSFNELYYPGYGNAELDPESSRTIETGLRGTAQTTQWSVAIYQTIVDDLISYDASINAPNNLDAARLRGAEATFATRIAAWGIQSALTLLDPENRAAGANYGKVLPRRAERALRIDADRHIGVYALGATWFGASQRYDDLANTVELGGYATVDIRAGYAFAQDWLLQARVSNLFDKYYQTAAFYNQPGRTLDITLRYQPSFAKP